MPGGEWPETSPRAGRAAESLRGLAVGDAFGDQFFGLMGRFDAPVQQRMLAAPPWAWTDDTNMAISVVEVLGRHGALDQEALARSFVERYAVERAYGPSLSRMLREAGRDRRGGAALREAAAASFGGQGSHGNGAAMRVAPLGAYFADDLAAAIEGAALSATVTHTHPEAVAGAIGVAVAAALAWRLRGSAPPTGPEFLDLIIPHLPPSEVRSRTERARSIREATATHHAALMLGNGTELSAQDTVPFALWCAGQHLGDYEAALWAAAESLGDMDTIAAIVGGIVVGYAGAAAIPPAWEAAAERLPPLNDQ